MRTIAGLLCRLDGKTRDALERGMPACCTGVRGLSVRRRGLWPIGVGQPIEYLPFEVSVSGLAYAYWECRGRVCPRVLSSGPFRGDGPEGWRPWLLS